MNLYNELVAAYGNFCIRGIFMSVLIVILCKSILKNRIDVLYATKLILFMLIFYSFIAIIQFTLVFILYPGETKLTEHFLGPYWFAYWSMLLMNLVLPLLLLIKKIRLNLWILFLVTMLMNIGWLFESYVIHMTSIHMDYVLSENPYFLYYREREILLRGVVLGVIVLVLGNVVQILRKHKTPQV